MTNISKINEIQEFFYRNLKEYPILASWCKYGDFELILEELMDMRADGIRFFPKLKKLVRPFVETPRNKLKVVMLSPTPFYNPDLNDGMAFSQNPNAPSFIQKLGLVWDVNGSVYKGANIERSVDLVDWANQGVLMWNLTPITNREGNRKFTDIWEPFNRVLFEQELANDQLIYVLTGRAVADYTTKHIGADNYRIITTSYMFSPKNKRWLNGGVFNAVNEILVNQMGKSKIMW